MSSSRYAHELPTLNAKIEELSKIYNRMMSHAEALNRMRDDPPSPMQRKALGDLHHQLNHVRLDLMHLLERRESIVLGRLPPKQTKNKNGLILSSKL